MRSTETEANTKTFYLLMNWVILKVPPLHISLVKVKRVKAQWDIYILFTNTKLRRLLLYEHERKEVTLRQEV